ncbi:MAG: hypothetical protein C4297_04280 [Gemmataceae bacterium]
MDCGKIERSTMTGSGHTNWPKPGAWAKALAGDERLVAGLHDPEARYLVEWLIAAGNSLSRAGLESLLPWLYGQARTARQFVYLWCHARDYAGASQLVGCDFPHFPLPSPAVNDPVSVMEAILASVQMCMAEPNGAPSLRKKFGKTA